MRLKLCVTLAVLLATAAARADTFIWSFSGATDSGSGTLTTAAGSAGAYTVTGISGITDGVAITSLIPVGGYPTDPANYPANDNLLFYPALGSTYFDVDGISYSLSNGAPINLYFGNILNGLPTLPKSYVLIKGVAETPVALTSVSVAAVPEPSSLLLLATGAVTSAIRLRRRR